MLYPVTERQAQIGKRVRERGFQIVADLALHFDVTIRHESVSGLGGRAGNAV